MTLLYHGTNGAWLEQILRHGLKPRGSLTQGNWKHTIPSNPKAVYATDSYAPYFAFQAARGKTPSCAVIEIDTERLDTDELFPDEDFLEQSSRHVPEPIPGSVAERTKHYRRVQFSYDWPCENPEHHGPTTWWQASLQYLGTCAHRGPIPASAITRAVYWPHRPNAILQLIWDPSITLLNQKIVGNRYRALTAKLFAGDFTTLEEAAARDTNDLEAHYNNPLIPFIEGWQLFKRTSQ